MAIIANHPGPIHLIREALALSVIRCEVFVFSAPRVEIALDT